MAAEKDLDKFIEISKGLEFRGRVNENLKPDDLLESEELSPEVKLHLAVMMQDYEGARSALQNGANPHVKIKDLTALKKAQAFGNEEIIQSLKKHALQKKKPLKK